MSRTTTPENPPPVDETADEKTDGAAPVYDDAVYERFAEAVSNGQVHPAVAELLAERFGPKKTQETPA